MKDNKEHMNLLFNYCMNYDIEEFNPERDRIITDAYNTMKQHNENPIYNYLYKNFVLNEYNNEFDKNDCKKKKNGDTLFIKSNVIFSNYNNFLTMNEKGYISPSYKLFKSLLGDLGITKQQVKINGKNNDYYVICMDELKEQLLTTGISFENKIEEYNDDDFE